MEGLLTMSPKEYDRLEIIEKLKKKEISFKESADLMEVSQRQVYRIAGRVMKEGRKGIIHKGRGKASNRGYPKEIKEKVIRIYRKDYCDYGPTLFAEKLIEHYGITLNNETVRLWLREKGITSSIRKKRPHRKKRERRSCLGELLQFDGSHHDWFEGRGAECCLLNCIDDATGRTYSKFSISENSYDVLLFMREYVEKCGIPRSIYVDRHSVYKGQGELTDFGRAMKELGIEIIYANSPQAKGRVERSHKTYQDRLVKALRERCISNIAEANNYLQNYFIRDYNKKFAVNHEAANVHRSSREYKLDTIFCYKTNRQVRYDYTINLNGEYIQLLRGEAPLPRPKQNVLLCKALTGELSIYYNDQEIKYEYLKSKPEKKGYVGHPVRADHPWRRRNQLMPMYKRNRFLVAQY